MKVLRTLLVVLMVISYAVSVNAQTRNCGTDALMEQLLQNPEFFEAHQQKLARAAQMAENQLDFREECTNTIVLPIAIHFQNISNPDRACLESLAANQIETVNFDFQGMNTDISNWDNNQGEFFPGISNGDACIQFCIPTMNHPSGFGLVDGDPAVTINQFNSDFSSAWSGYINVFVRNISALGYSPLGGDGDGDGVTVDINAFGTTPNCGQVTPNPPFHLGRTLTHELGHYFLLYHIWRNNGCGLDDLVSDTPLSDDSYGGCPSFGVSSCGSNDMHMNYMDYTNDACMYMFSAGQVTRMENYINSNLTNVINNAANVCVANEPTCNDGMQNGDEEGVDCGGSDCPPCVTCNDGIQNGDEEGVDCGGSCPPCGTGCIHNLQLQINFDGAPTQVTWLLTDDSGNTLDNGGPYSNAFANSSVTEALCVPDGCFNFTIFDAGGNGLCCRAGDGSFSLTGPNGVITTGSEYGFSQSTNFCLGDTPNPSCNDGIQNGDEEGVDCGGSCPPCQPDPTCDDGIQNGDEEGVDCGGSCPPCQPDPICNDGIQNGDEEGVDCGGSACPPCEEPSCEAPTGDNVVYFNSPRIVQIVWNPVAGATLYELKSRRVGTGAWSTRLTTSTSAVLNRLIPATDYEYEIRAFCSSVWSSATAGNFTTNSNRESGLTEYNVVELRNLYPNPARERVQVDLFSVEEDVVNLSVIDVLGREVYRGVKDLNSGMNTLQIDISQFTNGYHLLRIELNGEMQVEGFIKD